MLKWENIYEWLLDQDEMEDFAPRSSNWDELRDEIIESPGAECAACGGKKNLELHHIKDFSTFPELELCRDNLIILCRKSSRFKGFPCHRFFGHFMNWRNINPNVVRDTEYFRRNVDRMLDGS